MIPAYNCARYLRQSLESVLVQDLGPSHMQIEVVDDRSTEDDPEEVVREIGGGRVGFHRNPQNLGASANFNRCIELAVGQLIHILHGDDFVAPNFYAVIGKMAEQNPDCSFFATRTLKVDERGSRKVFRGARRVWKCHQIAWPNRDVSAVPNPICRDPAQFLRTPWWF